VDHDRIVPLAKRAGLSSFTSLWEVKRALGTRKVGHTGTLDSFADGLLVVLAGRMTRFAPFITDMDKEYLALVRFGAETDTLDPEGAVVAEAPLPSRDAVEAAVRSLVGPIMQAPPAYSAIHVDGKRASDRARRGEAVELPPRPVTIYEMDVERAETNVDAGVSTCALRVRCSKGTYIRSLARDVALKAGSRAHLVALRRTKVGPFTLDEAVGSELLPPFGSELKTSDAPIEDAIRERALRLDRSLALRLGLSVAEIAAARAEGFLSGRQIQGDWFDRWDAPSGAAAAVFAGDRFRGLAARSAQGRWAYGFVAGEGSQ